MGLKTAPLVAFVYALASDYNGIILISTKSERTILIPASLMWMQSRWDEHYRLEC